jgi:putative lipoprotein
MRSVVWSLMTVAALALAGCNSSGPSSTSEGAASSAAAQVNSVSGTITLRGPDQPSASDQLTINLVDVSAQGSAPLASKTIAPATTFPLTFQLSFNPSDVVPNDMYVVKAELVDGDRHYEMPLQAPVLTKGAPSQGVSIQLMPQQTPGEKELAAFQAVQKQIGGMKVKSGTRLEKDASRGWQVFRQDDEVKFIRELVDYGDKGFTSTDYAYKGGKPWVVEQQHKPNQGAKATSVDTAGWSDDGTLLLKQHQEGGKSTPLSDADAASLQQQAKSILDLATGGKDK